MLPDIDELIAKQLSGAANTAEQAELEKWLSESDANRAYYREMEKIWLIEPPKAISDADIDTEAALQKVKAQFRPRVRVWTRLASAATVALAIGFGLWLWTNKAPTVQTYAANQNIETDTLGDGSVATINRKSSIAVQLSDDMRKVQLQGEAFIAVAKNPARPFIVEVQKLQIKVVGTQFNVDNLSDTDKVVVQVLEGKVIVSFNGKQLDLIAGEAAVFDCNSGLLQKQANEDGPNVAAYKDKTFVFEDTPLSAVLRLLNKAYDSNVQLENPGLGNCKLFVQFKDEPLERVLELIAETLNLKITQKNNAYIISGKSCND